MFPKTRYQGSKYKLRDWIRSHLSDIDFNTAVDAFSGTSSIGYLMKGMGKSVISNDILPFNFHISRALVENSNIKITDNDYNDILIKKDGVDYSTFIYDTFKDIYYLDHENKWLDIVVQNIHMLTDEYKKSMFFFALFQSCISKRPYNLFHRKNLYVRTSNVKRSFGNKVTWDRTFEEHFLKFIKEANNSIFDNELQNKSYCCDIMELNIDADLIYVDPPYVPKKGSLTIYGDFYHFLNGISEYSTWHKNIDHESKHKKLKSSYSIWEDRKNILSGFDQLIEKNRKSIILLSYRSDGTPSIDDISNSLKRHGKAVSIDTIDYRYVLSKKKELKEVIIKAI